MKPELSIIIVNFNTKDLTLKCIDSIRKYPPKVPYEIIVVDNGSKEIPSGDFQIIRNKSNLGFAKAHNQGMKVAKGEYFLNLDSDIVAKPDSVKKLLDFAKLTQDGAVFGGRLINPDGTKQASARNLPSLLGAIKEYWFSKIGQFSFYSVSSNTPTMVEVVRGACFLIPKAIIEKIGFFEEKYFLYFEEIDYCRKAKRAGYKVYYVPQAVFVHHVGASGKKTPQKTRKWLIDSSKMYHGILRHYLINSIIWSGQKWQKLRNLF